MEVPKIILFALLVNNPNAKMYHLQESTYKNIAASTANAKAITLNLAIGQKRIQESTESMIVVLKEKGENFIVARLGSNSTSLVPSLDLQYIDHPIDVLMCIWFNDIFWWNPFGVKTATSIVHIEFWNESSREQITEFEEPSDLYFNLDRKDFKEHIFEDEIKVPPNYSLMYHEELNRHIHVYKVFLPKTHTLLLEFHNLSQSVSMEVVFREEKYPSIEDFADGTTVEPSGITYLVLSNDYNYHLDTHIGILPNKNITQKVIKYNISFSVTSCIYWDFDESQWVPTCVPGDKSNLSTLHCKCTKLTTMGGYIQNMVALPEKVLTEEMELHLQSNVVIFTTMTILFSSYCLLLVVLVPKRQKVPKRIYFLADNITEYLYTYLVLVITGKTSTTSHVMIKIHGETISTKAHVLNYPDPERKILQIKSKDVFVITTETSLKDIIEIELWIDGTGVEPFWLCQEIEIFDLQLRKSWYFKVKKLLSQTHVTVKASKRVEFLWNGYHTWCLWVEDEHFSYVKRLTIVLSIILMIFVLVLIFQGLPDMELMDSLDIKELKISWFDVLWAFTASLCSFLFHIFIACIFRASKVQYSPYSQKWKLPYSLTKACWKLLIVLIVVWITILIVYGFWVPFNASLVWFITCSIAVAFEIVIFENIFVIAVLFFEKPSMGDENEEIATIATIIEEQRSHLLRRFGTTLLKPAVQHLQEL